MKQRKLSVELSGNVSQWWDKLSACKGVSWEEVEIFPSWVMFCWTGQRSQQYTGAEGLVTAVRFMDLEGILAADVTIHSASLITSWARTNSRPSALISCNPLTWAKSVNPSNWKQFCFHWWIWGLRADRTHLKSKGRWIKDNPLYMWAIYLFIFSPKKVCNENENEIIRLHCKQNHKYNKWDFFNESPK